MKYSEQEYINLNLFEGDESEIKLKTVKLVKVRKPQSCFLSRHMHTIEVGQLARFEKALVDSDYWGSYYCCISCCDKELDFFNH